MLSQNMIPESTPHYVDFGSNFSNSIKSDDDVVYDRVPGLCFGDSAHIEFSNPSVTRSKARTVANSALADLQRATSEADAERLCGQTLRRYAATQGKKMANTTVKADSKPTQHPMTIRAILAQDTLNANNDQTSSPRRATNDLPLDSGGSYNKPNYAFAAKGNIYNTPHSAPRRPLVDLSLNSGGQEAGRAHRQGFLSVMDDFNDRCHAHTAAIRRLVDGGFISEGQLAATAVRTKPSADENALDEEVARKDCLATVRLKLAAGGRVVATVSQQVSSSRSHAVKSVPPMPVRPGPAQPCITVGTSKLKTRKLERCVPAGTAHPGFSATNRVKYPASNNRFVNLSPAGGLKPENEAAFCSTGHSVSRTLPIYDLGHAHESFSTKFATAAAPTTTTTKPNESVSEKAQAIAHQYASTANASRKPAHKVAIQNVA